MKDLKVNGEKVLVRVDFNVPMDETHKITDDTRIRAALPTIRHLLAEGAAVILLSHWGRPLRKPLPDGRPDTQSFTLRHLVDHLSGLLGRPVGFAPDCVGPEAEAPAAAMRPGEVLLLENTRFHAGEEKGDAELARRMAALGTVYVNDAFGAAHRAHAST
ncbi:MAG: phosphoglycerate kinase, partial [Saprospiraceae bacterium]|nr:phosphoglycerate kinase [Saprospiraceae bacterium]